MRITPEMIELINDLKMAKKYHDNLFEICEKYDLTLSELFDFI